MSKLILVFSAIFLHASSIFASDTLMWPISGYKPGEGILYSIEDFIEDEQNFESLFLTAKENTPVIAPGSGVVENFGYKYKPALDFSVSFKTDLTKITDETIKNQDYQQRIEFSKRHKYNPLYISYSITISTRDHGEITIFGLRPHKYFKTGTKISKGDTIGYVGFAYSKILQPCISLSISVNSKVADPLSPFGLKSSFVPYTPKPQKKVLSKSEMIEDFNEFRLALEEGHPGLNDYISRENMNDLFQKTLLKMPNKLSRDSFFIVLQSIVDSVRDGHTRLYLNDVTQVAGNQGKTPDLPIHFGYENDTLKVFQTLPVYKHLLGKHIIKINGVTENKLQSTVPMKIIKEGFINSMSDRNKLYFYIFYKVHFKYKQGDIVSFTFSDGTTLKLSYKLLAFTDFIPKRNKVDKTSNIDFRNIDPEIAYLNIKSFGLSEMEKDSIAGLMKMMNKLKIKNLIIDIRNNPGGDGSFIKIFSYLAETPFSNNVASMVKSNTRYSFLKYCRSYDTDTIVLFPDYKKVEGKDGYYILRSGRTKPDTAIHFSGRVILLANEYSYSAATLFACLIHKYKRGIIVGRETGSCYYQMNCGTFASVMLSNSGMELKIPLIKEIFDNQTDPKIPLGHGVIPDVKVRITYKELLKQEDPILNSAISLIHSSN